MSDSSAPPPPRRGRPGYDQETVLRRAIELFNRQGYDATSIGDLARELGLTKSAIYHHVPSKEALLAAALDEALDGLAEAIDAAANEAAGTSAYERLRTAVRQSVEILGDHLPAVTLLLRVRGNSEVELAALKRRRVIDDKLAGLVQAAVDEGSLRADIAPELISRLLFGMVNSLVEWYRPDGPVPVQEISAAIVDLAFEGLGTQQDRVVRTAWLVADASGLRFGPNYPGISRPVEWLRPRNSAITASSDVRVTVTSYTPERPRRARSVATATSTSPSRADWRRVTSKPDATVTVPCVLQAKAKALSASAAIRPPWQRSQPLIMSSRTVIERVAVPGPTETISMPSIFEAASPVHMTSAERRASSSGRVVGHASKSTVTSSDTGCDWQVSTKPRSSSSSSSA